MVRLVPYLDTLHLDDDLLLLHRGVARRFLIVAQVALRARLPFVSVLFLLLVLSFVDVGGGRRLALISRLRL